MLQNFQLWTKLHCNNYGAKLYLKKNLKATNSFTKKKSSKLGHIKRLSD